MKKILISVLFTLAVMPGFCGTYTSTTGWVTPCKQTGYDSELGAKCATWCKNQYGSTMYNTTVTSENCSNYGITDTSYKVCCVNYAAMDIKNYCKCADPNQITVADKSTGKSYTTSKSGSGDSTVLTLTCSDNYCFCNTAYYGKRQTMSVSTTGTCTKCPCMDDTYSASSGAQLCGWTANNYSSLTDNSKAPNTTLADCKAGPVPGVPEQYRTYNDTSGQHILSSYCTHSGDLCAEVSYKCSTTTGTGNAVGTPADTAGSGCWCYANGKYVYITTMGSASGCASSCPNACVGTVAGNATMRENLGCDG